METLHSNNYDCTDWESEGSGIQLTGPLPLSKSMKNCMETWIADDQGGLSYCLNAIMWVWLSNWLTAAIVLVRRSASWRLNRNIMETLKNEIVDGRWKMEEGISDDRRLSLISLQFFWKQGFEEGEENLRRNLLNSSFRLWLQIVALAWQADAGLVLHCLCCHCQVYWCFSSTIDPFPSVETSLMLIMI